MEKNYLKCIFLASQHLKYSLKKRLGAPHNYTTKFV